ncbi:MAG: hypothetical protein ABIT64_05935, partial [Lysobacteraceae bacterium]
MRTDPVDKNGQHRAFTGAREIFSMQPQPADALAKVLHQNENAKDLVQECATELSSVNTEIKQELKMSDPLPGVVSALEKSGAIVVKLQDVSEKLALVNESFEIQVRDRILLEYQFAAAVE